MFFYLRGSLKKIKREGESLNKQKGEVGGETRYIW